MKKSLKTLESSVKTNFTGLENYSTQTHKEALQTFQSDTINGDGADDWYAYYFVIPEAENSCFECYQKSLDLEEITELKHIETKESLNHPQY